MPPYKIHPDGRRLGKKPAKRDPRNLKLSKYILRLPAPPPEVDHESKVTAWGMMGNDQYGDCVMAALGHEVLQWTTYASRPVRVSDAAIIAAYLALSPNDDGLSILDTLKWMKNTGLNGHKIGAFVEIDPKNRDEVKLAVQLFGNTIVGISLPDKNTFGPWIDVVGPPNPWNGHCVIYPAFDPSGPDAATWGYIEPASWLWHDAYCDEGYAVLSEEWINSEGLTVEGFDLVQLQYDLAHIGDPVDPPGPLPPIPPPIPNPGCLGVLVCLAVSLTTLILLA